MRVGFAGTPDFAARALAAIHERGHTIPLVLTQPDRPSGRGMALIASAVKRYADRHALPVRQPARLNLPDVQAALRQVDLDVLVVAAYGLLLPQSVLVWPRCGCLNIHASLLPRWRGAAPIARAIEAGDTVTGITIMQMDAGLDTGPAVSREAVAIGARDTTGTLHDRLADVGARLIVAVLGDLERNGAIPAMPQPQTGATYAAKIERADRLVDWLADASTIDRKVRALTPAPGAVAGWQGAPFRIRAAQPIAGAVAVPAATVVAITRQGLDVACGPGEPRGILRLTEVQPADGRPMPANAFAAGRGIAPGTRFEPGA